MVEICSTCSHRQRPCRGQCVCLEDGCDIRAHSDAGYCPRRNFGTGIAPNGWQSLTVDVTTFGQPILSGEPPKPIPRDQWSWTARVLANLAVAGDRGLGDVMQRIAAVGGGEIFKRYYKRITGSDCGCADRQERLNTVYPLK